MASLVFEIVDAIFWMIASQILRSAFISFIAGAAVGIPILYLDGSSSSTPRFDSDSSLGGGGGGGSIVSTPPPQSLHIQIWADRAVFVVDAVTLGWVIIAVFSAKFFASVRNVSLGVVKRARALLKREGRTGGYQTQAHNANTQQSQRLDVAEAFLQKLVEEGSGGSGGARGSGCGTGASHGRSSSAAASGSGGAVSKLIQMASGVYGFASSHMERALGVASVDIIDEMVSSNRVYGWRPTEVKILDRFVCRGLKDRKDEADRIARTEESQSTIANLLESDD